MSYIVFDLDDTLLNDKREISPYTLNVMKKVQAMGHKLVYNTARSQAFSQKYFEQLRPDYAILNGGSLIIDKEENVVFSAEEFPFPAQKIVTDIKDDAQAQAIAEKYNLAFTTYMGGTFRRYNHSEATKAQGNRNLMKLTGDTLEDIIAFGDDYGDFDMLREAGVGVMMKNGRPELLGKTSHISEYTNDEDGVAKFLEKWFKLK